MIVEYPDRREHLDFVVPTVEEALTYIADGATNGLELLEDAGLSPAEAERRLQAVDTSGQ